jgi:DNA invertase Pin-like site-specific DNA recombinase
MANMNNAVIYARYSSDKQDYQSIEGQIAVCKEFARKNNLTVIEIYIDQALSGKTDDRPEFMRMIRDSYSKDFQYVVIYALDRFARNRYDSATNNAILKKNGIKRLSATEGISDSPQGVLMESILEGYAEYFSLELAVKVKRGMHENLKKGKTIGGTAAFGYGFEDKVITIIESEASIVKQVFDLFIGGSTITEIAQILNERGILNRQHKKWNYGHIYQILTNEKYTGKFIFDDIMYDDVYPVIIDTKTFEMVLEKVSTKKRRTVKSNIKYYLTGKLYCGKCERTMNGQSAKSGQYRYYSCNSLKRDHKCEAKRISKDNIERFISRTIISILNNQNVLEPILDKIILDYNESISKQSSLTYLKSQKKKIESEISNIIKAIKKGIISSSLQEDLSALESSLIDIDKQIAIESYKNGHVSKDDLLYVFDYMRRNLIDETQIELILNTFLEMAVVNEKQVTIVLKINPNVRYSFDITDLNSSSNIVLGVPFKE